MILEDLKQLKSGPRELRKFGLMVGGVFAGLGLLAWVRGKPHFPWLLTPGAGLMLLGLIFPRSLKPVYLAWMSVALVLGFIVSHVILVLLFLLAITPIGLAARLCGRDFLRLKIDRSASSYWLRREQTAKSKADYERQF
jgi:hypothetical protein